MAPSIGSFFWEIYPLIRTMDSENQINPKNYSKILGVMIIGFMSMFALALIFAWPF